MQHKTIKDLICEKLDEREIFAYYIFKITGKELQLGKAIRSPLRAVDRHPSFNIFKGKDGKIRFKDFAGQQGDVFEFIKVLFNCDFMQACKIITSDFSLAQNTGISKLKAFRQMNLGAFPCLEKKERAKINFSENREWTSKEKDFWMQYGITGTTLLIYNVKSIANFKTGKITRESSADYRIFGYTYQDSGSMRFYCPDDKNLKHIGNANGEDIFGMDLLNQCKEKEPLVILCAGQKDAMAVYEHTQTIGISLNSESCGLSKEQYMNIMQHTKKLLVLYDNDATGRKYANKLHEQYGLEIIDIAQFTKCKDISDYYKEQIQNNTKENKLWEIIRKMKTS